jgi:hypothetical protein
MYTFNYSGAKHGIFVASARIDIYPVIYAFSLNLETGQVVYSRMLNLGSTNSNNRNFSIALVKLSKSQTSVSPGDTIDVYGVWAYPDSHIYYASGHILNIDLRGTISENNIISRRTDTCDATVCRMPTMLPLVSANGLLSASKIFLNTQMKSYKYPNWYSAGADAWNLYSANPGTSISTTTVNPVASVQAYPRYIYYPIAYTNASSTAFNGLVRVGPSNDVNTAAALIHQYPSANNNSMTFHGGIGFYNYTVFMTAYNATATLYLLKLNVSNETSPTYYSIPYDTASDKSVRVIFGYSENEIFIVTATRILYINTLTYERAAWTYSASATSLALSNTRICFDGEKIYLPYQRSGGQGGNVWVVLDCPYLLQHMKNLNLTYSFTVNGVAYTVKVISNLGIFNPGTITKGQLTTSADLTPSTSRTSKAVYKITVAKESGVKYTCEKISAT